MKRGEIIELFPSAVTWETHQAQATEKREKGDLKGAIAAYTKAIELSPPNTALYYMRGVTYSDLKEYQHAFEDFTKGLELDPQNESLRFLLKQAAQALKTPATPVSSSAWIEHQAKATKNRAKD